MRRRRNAASDDANDVVSDTTSLPDSLGSSEPPAETEAPRPRRRAPRKKESDPALLEAVEPTVAPSDDVPAASLSESGEPAVAKRPRSRRKAEPAPVAPTEPEVVVEPTEAIAPSTSVARTRRARRKAEAETILSDLVPERETASTPEPTPVVEAIPEPPLLQSDVQEPEVVSEGRSRRRRRGRGGRGESAPVVEAEPIVDEPEGDKPKRTRGLRRTRTVAAPTLMVSGEDVPILPPAEDVELEDDGKPKRLRGTRRSRGADSAVVLLPPPIAGVVAPVEPLPPVYQPLSSEVLAQLAEAKVVVRKGVAELMIQGEPRLPFLFFVNMEAGEESLPVAQREIRYAYEAGVRLFTVLAHLPWKSRSGERRFDLLDSILRFVTENAPDALILPRLIFSPPASWVRANPGEMVRYASGEVGDVSLGSRLFWEGEADEALRAAVEHIAQSPYAGNVFGFYLEHGEWLHEKGVGYDLSDASVSAFRAWLRARYKNATVALRAAWHDGGVTFETAQIPSWPVPAGLGIFLGPKERRWQDFHQFMSERVAEVIGRLGKAVKEASGGRSAVAVSCGYTLELPRTNSGHLALGDVLASPYVDILTAPFSYSGRVPGGSAPLPLPVESVVLAGKLCILEDDTKTFLASGTTPDSYNPHVPTVEGTRAVHLRNFGAALAHGAGISYMDLWGEGWLDDRETWEFLSGLREIAEQYATRRRNPRTRANADPDVAVIVDEQSFFEVRDERLLEKLVTAQRDVLLRSGARIGFYLQSDLTRKNFPETPKLLIFLNAFRIEPAVRAAIRERWQDSGRTLAWVFTPGIREESLSELAETFGMQLRLQPYASKIGTRVFSDAKSPLVDTLRGQKLGEELRVHPSLTVSDSRTQVLGEYPTGNPSLAVRKHPRWQTVFLGEPVLSQGLLRGLYRLAGVPIYSADDDVAWVGDAILTLHSAPGGGTTVYLQEEGILHDFVYGETLSRDGRGARLSIPPQGTRLLYFGPLAEAQRFGAEPETAPPGLTQSELPVTPAPFLFETPSALGADSISAEDEALFQAALADLPAAVALLDEEIVQDNLEVEGVPELEEEVGSEPNAKRRRRRRGRGRGEGSEPLASDALASSDVSPTPLPEPEPIRRPSLEELLPLSEAPMEGDIPPIPEEFLLEQDAPPSRRGSRGRRIRGRAADAAVEESPSAETPEG